MSDRRDDSYARPVPAADSEPSTAELLEGAVRKIVSAIVIAGALIGGAIYWSGGGEAPRYQVTAADGRIIRVNTDSGTVIACETANGECGVVLRRGQDLAEEHSYTGAPAEYLTFWVRRARSGVRFTTDENRRVDTILAGNDSIQYIEGCA